jgi:hypothetical protein
MSDESTQESRLNDRFVRWQEALRQTLGSHVALIVGFSSGGLGFVGVILNSADANLKNEAGCMLSIAGVLFLLSLALAIYISLNRLRDVRSTLEILSKRREKATETVIFELRGQTKKLGDRTWTATYCQVWIFMVAAVFFSVGMYFAFRHKM